MNQTSAGCQVPAGVFCWFIVTELTFLQAFPDTKCFYILSFSFSCPLFTQPFSYFRKVFNGLYKLSWNGSFNYLWLERWQLFGLENRMKGTCIIMMIFSSPSTVIYLKAALIKKKKTKFSSYIRKFRWDRLVQCHVIYEEGLSNIWRNA